LCLALSIPSAAQTADTTAAGIINSAAFKQATAFIERDQERFVRELVALTEIPSPPFKEQARAQAYLEMLRQHGLSDVEMDPEGNVMGVRKGAGDGLVAVVAHLDTVFPEGTDVTVKRQGTRLAAPGVGDDTRGLALMLAIIRAMDAAKVRTRNDILFVGNVGEEGEGDLRGVKYLLQKGRYKDRVKQFIAIDGDDQKRITNGGVGSRRYRVAFNGPGGHSYGAFGLVNPAFAMGNAIVKFSRVQVVAEPKTTFNVGVVREGHR
jgi:tripeptide aminopeptidase